MAQAVFEPVMNILWILDKELDVALNVSARLATIGYLEKHHNLTVVTSFRREKRQFSQIRSRIVYLKSVNVPYLKISWLYYRQLRLIQEMLSPGVFDLVFVNSGNYLLLKKLVNIRKGGKPKLLLDVRTLPTEASRIRKRMSNFLFRKSLEVAARDFDGISYITETMRTYCAGRFRLPRHRSIVWGTGVDLGLFKLSPPASAEAAKIKIMYHGKIASNRGIGNVILAMSRLSDLEIEFLLLGYEREFGWLRQLVRDCGLESRVTFLGHVPHEQVPDYITLADAGILPFPDLEQWNTSSAIKLFEYLACGRPVILTRIPAHVEVLNGREFAFWVDRSSPDDLAKAMRTAAHQKPNFGRLGQEARRFVEERFGWMTQLEVLDEFMKSL
jgi:glycosyltransferase involved in cell wall biosynthesis